MPKKTFTTEPITYFALTFWHNGKMTADPESYGNVSASRTADYAYHQMAIEARHGAFDDQDNPIPCPHCEMRKVRVVNGATKVSNYRQVKFAETLRRIWCENVPPHHPDHKQAD